MVEYNEIVSLFHADGTEYHTVEDKVTYSGKWMGGSNVTFDVVSPSPIDFRVGDYLMFRGQRFELNYLPGAEQQSTLGTAMEGFKYSGVTFNDYTDELVRCSFMDTVTDDNHVHYCYLVSFSFWCETAQALCDRIKANLDRLYYTTDESGARVGLWTVQLGDDAAIKDRYNHNISVDNVNCYQALQLANTQWSLNYTVRGRVITIGTKGRNVQGLFKYGRSRRLTAIERSSDSSQQLVTRLHAYGNTTNLPHLFYQNDLYRGFSVTFRYEKAFVQGHPILVACSGYDAENVIRWVRNTPLNCYWTDASGKRVSAKIRTIYGGKVKDGRTFSEHKVTEIDLSDTSTMLIVGYDDYSVLAYNAHGYFALTDVEVDGVPMNGDSAVASFTAVKHDMEDDGIAFTLCFENVTVSADELPMKFREIFASEISIPSGVSINNLMLPGFPEKSLREMYPDEDDVYLSDDPFDPWIGSKNSDELGIREGCTFFNGSGNDNEDVYPTIKDMHADYLRDAGYDVSLEEGDNGMLDEVRRAVNPTDDGDLIRAEYAGESLSSTFVVKIKDIGFDISSYTDGNSAINMTSGMCGGRSFDIVDVTKEEYGYSVTCKRTDDGSVRYPNRDFCINPGDEFTITGIFMPAVYIKAASARLYNYAKEWLAENDHTFFTYTPSVDNIWLAENFDVQGDDSVYATIMPGDTLFFKSEELGIDHSVDGVSVDTIEIESGDADVAKVKITLKDKPTIGTIQKIQNQVDYIRYQVLGGAGSSLSSNVLADLLQNYVSSEDLSRFESRLPYTYARLSYDNTFSEYNTFLKTVKAPGFKTESYTSGDLAGSGASVFEDSSNLGHVETDFLSVRRAAFFRQLTIAEVKHIGGEVVLSQAACQIAKVEMYDEGDAPTESLSDASYFRCYFEKNANGRSVDNEWCVGDQARCSRWQTHEDSGEYSTEGFYWRLVVGVHEASASEDYHYIDLSVSDCASGSSYPRTNDNVVLLGHRGEDHPERTTAQVYSTIEANSPSRRYYHGITSYSTDGKSIETMEWSAVDGFPHWNVGSSTEFIDFSKDGLEVRASRFVLASGKDLLQEATESAAEYLGDTIHIYRLTDQECPMDDDNNPISPIAYNGYQWLPSVTEGWISSDFEEKDGDVMLTSDGFVYQFEKVGRWVIVTDQYLISFVRGLKDTQDTLNYYIESGIVTKENYVQMYSTAVGADGKTLAEAIAGTYVEVVDGEWISGYKIHADVMSVSTKNFTLDQEGNATFSGVLNAATGSFSGTVVVGNDDRYVKIDEENLSIALFNKFPSKTVATKVLDIHYDELGEAVFEITGSEWGNVTFGDGRIKLQKSQSHFIDIDVDSPQILMSDGVNSILIGTDDITFSKTNGGEETSVDLSGLSDLAELKSKVATLESELADLKQKWNSMFGGDGTS